MAIATLALPANASADLVVSQTASPRPVKQGELVTITVSVTNSGLATADSDESQVRASRGGALRTAAV